LEWDRIKSRRTPDLHGWLKAVSPTIDRIWTTPGLIYICDGAPALEQMPVARLRQAHADAWEDAANALSYGDGGGYPPLREAIAERMTARGVPVNPDGILVTNGSQQGLDLVGRALLDEGDIVVVEGPTYFGAVQAFDQYQVQYRVAPMDEHGLIPEGLEPLLYEEPRPKILYTVPTFQNPTGVTIPEERRKRIIEMARAANVAIVEDDPYGDIYFTPEPIPPLRALDPNVIYLGTFSKTLAPALRMGWMVAPPDILESAAFSKEAVDMMSDRFVQRAVVRTIENGWLDHHLAGAREFYRGHRDAMLAALDREMPDGVTWTQPDGGFFLWVTLPDGYTAEALLEVALKHGVGFLPGSCFYPYPKPEPGFRLSYPTQPREVIDEAVKRLGAAMRELLG
jgi:2-aminoadipate transaminase